MGVEGLWGLVEGCNRSVKLEGLGQKKLAVDASIWIYQFLRGMEGKGGGGGGGSGRTVKNSHIVGFFWRICKLLFFNIHPVFVFDGPAPALKRQTMAARKAKNLQAQTDLDAANAMIMDTKLRMHALRAVEENSLSSSALAGDQDPLENEAADYDDDDDDDHHSKGKKRTTSLERKEKKKRAPTSTKARTTAAAVVSQYQERDLFELPPLPDHHLFMHSSSSDDFEAVNDDDGDDEGNTIHDELNPVKMDDETLDSLPPRVQLEIVSELQSKSRETSWSRLKEMVNKAPTQIDFSKQQILNTLRRNELTKKLDLVRDRVNKEHFSKGVDARRIVSSETKEYVLMQRGDPAAHQSSGEEDETDATSEESSGDSDYEKRQKRKRLKRLSDLQEDPEPAKLFLSESDHENTEEGSWGDHTSGGYFAEESPKPRTASLEVLNDKQVLKAIKPFSTISDVPLPAMSHSPPQRELETPQVESESEFEDVPDYSCPAAPPSPSRLPFQTQAEPRTASLVAQSPLLSQQTDFEILATPSRKETQRQVLSSLILFFTQMVELLYCSSESLRSARHPFLTKFSRILMSGCKSIRRALKSTLAFLTRSLNTSNFLLLTSKIDWLL